MWGVKTRANHFCHCHSRPYRMQWICENPLRASHYWETSYLQQQPQASCFLSLLAAAHVLQPFIENVLQHLMADLFWHTKDLLKKQHNLILDLICIHDHSCWCRIGIALVDRQKSTSQEVLLNESNTSSPCPFRRRTRPSKCSSPMCWLTRFANLWLPPPNQHEKAKPLSQRVRTLAFPLLLLLKQFALDWFAWLLHGKHAWMLLPTHFQEMGSCDSSKKNTSWTSLTARQGRSLRNPHFTRDADPMMLTSCTFPGTNSIKGLCLFAYVRATPSPL